MELVKPNHACQAKLSQEGRQGAECFSSQYIGGTLSA